MDQGWCCLGLVCGDDALGPVFPKTPIQAYKHLDVKYSTDKRLCELTFQEMRGMRIAGALELADRPQMLFRLRVHCPVINATQEMTCGYLVASRNLHDPCLPLPGLDMVHPMCSCVVVAMQHLGSLAAENWLGKAGTWIDGLGVTLPECFRKTVEP